MTNYTPAAIATLSALAAHPGIDTREGELLEAIRKEVGAPRLPTYEEVFADHFQYGLPAVPLDKLAVFNDNDGFQGSTTKLGKTMNFLSEHFGGDNVVNPYAEVDPARVVVVLGKIIAMGRLYNPVKCFKLESTDQKTKKKVKLGEFQVYDGRNRTAALAILFGPKVKIPMWVGEESKSRAMCATLDMNNSRRTKNLEKVAVRVVESQAIHATPTEGFAAMRGEPKKIAAWVAGHTHILRTKLFNRVSFQVVEKVMRGIYAVPMVGYQDAIKHGIRFLDKDKFLKELEVFQEPMNKLLDAIDVLVTTIPKSDETGELRNYFTAYSCTAYGKMLGELLFVSSLTPAEAGTQVAIKAAQYLKLNGPADFNQKPPSELVTLISGVEV